IWPFRLLTSSSKRGLPRPRPVPARGRPARDRSCRSAEIVVRFVIEDRSRNRKPPARRCAKPPECLPPLRAWPPADRSSAARRCVQALGDAGAGTRRHVSRRPTQRVPMCAKGNQTRIVRPGGRLLVGLLLLYLTGCGADTNVVPLSDAEKKLSKVAMAYAEAFTKLGHGPKDAEELKPFLKDF